MSEFSELPDGPNLDTVKDLIKRPEPEVLKMAEVVIRDIVNTSEETILESSHLNHISGHQVQEIRTALGIKAQQIMSMPGSRFRTKSASAVEAFKRTKDGVACLWLASRLDDRGNPIPGLQQLNLDWKSGNPPQLDLDVNVSLQDISRHPLSFRDRKGVVSSQWLEKGFDLLDVRGSEFTTIRKLWRGLRWLSANLDAWESPNFIMPEDLPQQSVQPLPEPTRRQLT